MAKQVSCGTSRTHYKIIVNGKHRSCALTKAAAKSICRRQRKAGKRCSYRKSSHSKPKQIMRLF